MKAFKKLVSILVIIALIGSCSPTFAVWDSKSDYNSTIMTKEEILDHYWEERESLLSNYKLSIAGSDQVSPDLKREYDTRINELQDERDSQLLSAGYLPYRVNASNFREIESQLNCSFEDIGLKPNGNYLIIIGNGYSDAVDSRISSTRGTPGSTFNYAYNGTTYLLRTLTVTEGDLETNNQHFAMADEISLLNSNSITWINQILNGMLCLSVGLVNTYLGYVYTILGISPINIGNSHNSTLSFRAYAVWTRTYTQVWSSYDQAWTYGSCVEHVFRKHRIQGAIWREDNTGWDEVDTYYITGYKDSAHFNNTGWCCDTAIVNYLYSYQCTFDIVGNIQFLHDDVCIINFNEPGVYP